MIKNSNTFYWLTLALVIALASAYYEQRGLQARYEKYQDTMQTVSEQRQTVDALKARLDDAQSRLEGMNSSPLEQEATIRRVKRLVREGEIIYRVEATK